MSSKHSESQVEQFAGFCKLVELKLEPFQLEIVKTLFERRRESLILIPRGNGKTTLLAALALYHLLTVDGAKVAVGAASRDQASTLFDICRNMASHPAIAKRVYVTRREIRKGTDCWIKVVASDGPKQHGLVLTLAIVDELHAHRDDELYIALRTGMLKRPDAQMWTISTAGIGEESALGSLRVRARQGKVKRKGPFTRSTGPNLAMLEWSLPDGASIDDTKAVKEVNPASWLSEEALEEQREAVHEIAFRRYHCNQWVAAQAPWITGDLWDLCSAEASVPDGSRVVLGVDASIRHDTTCVATVRRDENDNYHAKFRIWTPGQGQEVEMENVVDFIRDQGKRFEVMACAYDPQFMHHAAQRLEAEGMVMLEWPQNNTLMVPATRTLHEIVVHRKLRHGGDPVARSHALAAEVWETERGVRIKKTASQGKIDSTVALAMAVEWASRNDPPPARSRYDTHDLVGA